MSHKSLVIDLKNISFSYGRQQVLQNISLQIEAGSYVGLIGHNGSGKSTLLKIMLGLLAPSQGSVELFGLQPNSVAARSKLGYIPQKATQLEQRFPITVSEVVGLGLISAANVANGALIVDSTLKQLDLYKLRNKSLHQLSGGQQQRVFIAKELVRSPELLILDEPTVGVDELAQAEFYQLLANLNEEGKTIIIVSHDTDVILKEVKEIACLNKTLVFHSSTKGLTAEMLLNGHDNHHQYIGHRH